MAVDIREVCGIVHASLLNYLNTHQAGFFPRLATKHLAYGNWWLAINEANMAVGFAGLVPMTPFDQVGVGYLKRAYVIREYRGQGLQLRFLEVREAKAREIGYRMLVSECAGDNDPSSQNFAKAGFSVTEPEQCWGEVGSTYFVKRL